MKTVKTILELSSDFLQKHGVKRARFVADTLLSHYLGLERIALYMHFDRPLVEQELALFREALKRAAKHEPLDYILGEVEFFGTKIKVGPGVLIPRQETEILMEHVCRSLDGTEKMALDLCTGSGCIAASLKNRVPSLAVTGVDLSKEALAIAKSNHDQVEWVEGDLTGPLFGKKFDLVICNPPYVTQREYEELERSVRDYEPKMALVAGERGTEFYSRLERELPGFLQPGAKLFFEIGTGQGKKVQEIFSSAHWENQQVVLDLAGHERFFLLNLKENSPIMESIHYV